VKKAEPRGPAFFPPRFVTLSDGRLRLGLGDLFRIWGRRLGPRQLLSFTSASPVRAYVAGRRFRGRPADVPLEPGAQIVLELGAYVPPHARYLFPQRRA